MIPDTKRYTWSEENVDRVQADPAVYELYENDELIYIGSTNDLSERFKGYASSNFSDNPCKRATITYKREYVSTESSARTSEKIYLLEYQSANGKLPRCNKKIT